LNKIHLNSQENLMKSSNLAIVFAPNLLRSLDESPEIVIGDSRLSTFLFIKFIEEPLTFFNESLDEIMYNRAKESNLFKKEKEEEHPVTLKYSGNKPVGKNLDQTQNDTTNPNESNNGFGQNTFIKTNSQNNNQKNTYNPPYKQKYNQPKDQQKDQQNSQQYDQQYNQQYDQQYQNQSENDKTYEQQYGQEFDEYNQHYDQHYQNESENDQTYSPSNNQNEQGRDQRSKFRKFTLPPSKKKIKAMYKKL